MKGKKTKETKESEEVKDKEEKSGLEELKENYEKYRKKFSLPKFSELNESFDIEEIPGKDTELFVRHIRRKLTERTNTYLRLMEVFMNPSQASLFFMMLGKNMTSEGKEAIKEAYITLGKLEVKHFQMEAEYSEKKEAEFIKEIHKAWKEKIKKNLKVIGEVFEESWNSKSKSKDKGYFG